jgi:hypothetical protein
MLATGSIPVANTGGGGVGNGSKAKVRSPPGPSRWLSIEFGIYYTILAYCYWFGTVGLFDVIQGSTASLLLVLN